MWVLKTYVFCKGQNSQKPIHFIRISKSHRFMLARSRVRPVVCTCTQLFTGRTRNFIGPLPFCFKLAYRISPWLSSPGVVWTRGRLHCIDLWFFIHHRCICPSGLLVPSVLVLHWVWLLPRFPFSGGCRHCDYYGCSSSRPSSGDPFYVGVPTWCTFPAVYHQFNYGSIQPGSIGLQH